MYLQAMRIILAFEFQEAFPLAPTLALIIEKLEHDTKDENEGQASVCLSSFLYHICYIRHGLQDFMLGLTSYFVHLLLLLVFGNRFMMC